MAGGSGPGRKGKGFERELVVQALGFNIPSKRAWGSNGESLGMDKEVDCLVGQYTVQAKRKKRIPQWMIPAVVDMVAVREDRGETFIVMRYKDVLELIQRSLSNGGPGT